MIKQYFPERMLTTKMPPTFWRLNSAAPLSGFSLKTRRWTQSKKSHHWLLMMLIMSKTMIILMIINPQFTFHWRETRLQLKGCANADVDNNDDDTRLPKLIIMLTMINVVDDDQLSTYIALTDVNYNDDDNWLSK